MNVKVARDRLGDLYPGEWYVPSGRVIAGPGSTKWSALRPEISVTQYPGVGPLPYEVSLNIAPLTACSLVMSAPLSGEQYGERMAAAGDWSAGERARTGRAWHEQARLSEIADHLVVGHDPQDPLSVQRVELAHRRNATSITVVQADGTALVRLRAGGVPGGTVFGYTIRIDTPSWPRSRALYGAALSAWHWWWRRKTRQPSTWGFQSREALVAPWPAEFSLTGDGEHLLRVLDVGRGEF
ncbi:hypothetical protein ACFC0M_05925 [Streptomyces sp. NPDC056149]|uniref:hypothetical protein n=1 Tax=Streptomyces sp. NPDC056149 TaxID=3345728 RepID=UPI0035E3B2B9